MGDDELSSPVGPYDHHAGEHWNAKLLREATEEARERARQIGEGAPLAGGGQRKLLDYIIAECDTRITQVQGRLASAQMLKDFRDFLGNLSDFIGEA